MKNLIITTTNSIESAHIIGYLGIVRSNMIVGTNVFKDLFASFSDFFGGFSGKYKGELNRVYEAAFKELKQTAWEMHADAVVGLHVDFDEISGKDKSMLMVSIVGTAVNLSYDSPLQIEEVDDEIDATRVEYLISLANIQEKLKVDKWFPTSDDWSELISRGIKELANELYLKYIEAVKMNSAYIENPASERMIERFKEYFLGLDRNDMLRTVYGNFEVNQKLALSLIQEYDLFDIKSIAKSLNVISKDVLFELLRLAKSSYKKSDIAEYEKVINHIENLPVTSTTKVATGLIGKGKEYEYCESGHRFENGEEFCRDCGKNRQGVTKQDIDTTTYLKQLVEILRNIQ